MKRLLTHFLVQLVGWLTVTKLAGLATLTFLDATSLMIRGSFYLFFMFPILFGIGYFVDKQKISKVGQIALFALLGSGAAWGFQLIEFLIYHQSMNLSTPVGWFEDEFWNSLTFVLPVLVIGEIVWLGTKRLKNREMAVFALLVFVGIGGTLWSFMKVPPAQLAVVETIKSSQQRPNIILILADDLGYGDISLHGNKLIQTPNIDGIAKNGVEFTRAYASASVCAPSRAGLLTGRYQQRFGFEFLTDPFALHPRVRQVDFERYGNEFNQIPWYKKASLTKRGMPNEEHTIADILNQKGYKTAVTGKWHIGIHPRMRPNQFGFQEHYGILGAGSFYAKPGSEGIVESRHTWDFTDNLTWQAADYYTIENGEKKAVPNGAYMTDYIARKSVEFIKTNKENAFFLHAAFTAPHSPFQAPQAYYDKLSHIEDHNRRVYYAMIACLDDAVGQIIQTVNDLGLAENTLIVFTSDNGGANYTRACDNSPFYGGKMSNYEGGVVVPFMMQWAGRLDSGKVFQDPVSLLDVAPTVMASINIPKPKGYKVDGVNLLPFLAVDTPSMKAHDVLFWRTGYVQTMRKGDYKLHINQKEGYKTLVHLGKDVREQENLYDKLPKVVQKMEEAYTVWNSEMLPPRWESNADVQIPMGVEEDAKLVFFPW